MRAAIVTGVSRGLGEALARVLLERGFAVLGVGRSASSAPQNERVRFVACDLAQVSAIDSAVAAAFEGLKREAPESVTLINNAAVAWPAGIIGRIDTADAQVALATNVAAPLALCNAFLRTFDDDAIARRIINISSGAAHSALPGSAVYSMSKAALEMLTKSIAAEHSAPNFRCVTLRPGIFDTDMQTYMRSLDPAVCPSVALFRGFKQNAMLKAPPDVAAAIVRRLVEANVEHGRTYSHTDL